MTCGPSGCGRQFDAVLVHDAVDYVTNQGDLSSVIGTAFAHCRPGGLAVFAPDHTAETFRAGRGGGGGHDGTGRQASFRERTSDPVPGDDWILAEYEFTLRDAGRHGPGRTRKRTGSGRSAGIRGCACCGLAGFAAETRLRDGNGAASAKVMFIGRRDPDPP